MCMKKADPKASVCISNVYGHLNQCVAGIGNGISVSGIPWKNMSIDGENLADALARENAALTDVLRRFGTDVLAPETVTEDALESAYGPAGRSCGLDQQFPRGCVCIVANDLIEFLPYARERRTGMLGLYRILQDKSKDNGVCWYSTPNCPLMCTPEDYPFLDSRDIIQLDDKMIIGLHADGKGTNAEGFRWMRNTFAFHDVRAIELPEGSGHLGMYLAVIRPGLAMVCRDVVKTLPTYMSEWDIIEITAEEAESGMTDGLSLDERTYVIGHSRYSDPSRLVSELSARGVDVAVIDFTAHIELSGSVGSAVLPLRRDVPE